MAFEDYPVAEKRFDPDDVLALIVDDARLFDRPHRGDRLVRESSINELHKIYGTSDYWELGKALNQQFAIQVTKTEWMRILYPAREHRVGELCDFLAHRASGVTIVPLSLGGSTSASAGAFLAVRRTFEAVGANVSEIRPSSPLEPYLRNHPQAIVLLNHIAPGRLPTPLIDAPVHAGFALAGFLCGWAAFIGGCVGLLRFPCNWLTGCAFVCWIVQWLIARTVKPARVQLSWMQTFRDLSRVLAGEREGGWPAFEVAART
jgi:hypothetical protein